jgi:AraC family transcriptional regulator of adaptative response/methylated-DNA-[protein]-cysteine methyltransferase
VEHACRLLEQDPALTLDGLAQQVAMSPFHFHRLFKSVTGMTPKAWQQAARGQRLRGAARGYRYRCRAGRRLSRQQQLLS